LRRARHQRYSPQQRSSEWRGTDASFKVHDWNGDGVLSGNEVRVGAWRPARGTPPADFDTPDVAHVFGDWTVAGFYRLDHNSDGRVELSEWHFDREAFFRVDHNRDGALTREEAIGAVLTAPDLFTSLDVNGDGVIQSSEWHWSRESFDARDGNRDGRITRDEAAGGRDRANGLDFNLDARPELSTADAGFQGAGVTRFAYQAGYRDGFRRGYREAYSPR
jgi:Ca2+-binding EF-hand superfamily protein